MKRNRKLWNACVILVVILVVLGYTPIMIPYGVYQPMLLGIPYSLWTSILVTIALVALTYAGAKVHPGTDTEESEP
jgi:hypothetical protein